MRFKYKRILLVLVIISITSCKKFVEVQAPSTSLTKQNTYSSDATAATVLTGIYGVMGSGGVYTGSNGISLNTGLSSDELTLSANAFSGSYQHLYENDLSAANNDVFYWGDFYQRLLTINSALEGLTTTTSLTPVVKSQLLGEAYFLRAFFHFYLTSFYGDVPIVTSSDWRVNAVSARKRPAEVYQQIIEDLINAEDLLSDRYVMADALTVYASGSEERIRPNKWAAAALLARVYLYNGYLTGDASNYVNAEMQASSVINESSLFNLNTLDGAFTKNNSEAIWQIQYVNPDWNTEGFHFILNDVPGFTQPTYLSDFLLNAFESSDQRKLQWIKSYTDGTNTYYYPFKYREQVVSTPDPNTNVYPPPSEYFMVLRLAEQYLIRAEARAKQNKMTEAIADVDQIRGRAQLPLIANTNPAITQAALVDTILHERQVELFTEWGHRWFDLKRTGKMDVVMGNVLPVKRPGFAWNTNWQFYPIYQGEIKLNPYLAPNNPGY